MPNIEYVMVSSVMGSFRQKKKTIKLMYQVVVPFKSWGDLSLKGRSKLCCEKSSYSKTLGIKLCCNFVSKRNIHIFYKSSVLETAFCETFYLTY